jgi:hypothetical protein
MDILYHGTNENIESGFLEPKNPALNWPFSLTVKQKIQPSVSFYESKKPAKNGSKNVYKVCGEFKLLDLVSEKLTVIAQKYLKINNEELAELNATRSIKDWATSQKAYKFLIRNSYDGIVVWDAGNIGEDLEIRLFEKQITTKI